MSEEPDKINEDAVKPLSDNMVKDNVSDNPKSVQTVESDKKPNEHSFEVDARGTSGGTYNQGEVHNTNYYSSDVKTFPIDSKISLIKESKTFFRVKHKLDGFEEKLSIFKESNILLLGDKSHGKSPNIAYSLASEIEKNDNKENIRTFSLDSRQNEELTIQQFSYHREKTQEVQNDIVIVIDATKYEGKFVGSLLECSITFEENLQQALKENKVYLICLIPVEHIHRWLKSKDEEQIGFPNWIVTEDKNTNVSIEIQKEFEDVVTNLYEFSYEERIVIQTILYVGAFFPNLPFADFIYLVDLWLLTEEPEKLPTISDESEKTEIHKPTPKQLWDAKNNFYFRKCCFYQSKTEDSKKFVAIKQGYNETLLQEILEENIPVTIQQKIESIIRFGLVFHKSEDIAKNSIELFAKYFLDSEETNDNWFLYAFRFFETNEILDETLDEAITDILGEIPHQYIRDREKGLTQKTFYYRRIARIISEMLLYEQLKPVVKRVLDQLISETYYRAVFILVKQLQYSANFDEYYWLKRLLDEGNKKLQQEIEAYILSNLINNNVSIENIKEWFPIEDEKRSNASEKSLSLLIKYVMAITQNFDEQLFHLEPNKFPLFIYEDKQIAENRLEFIIRYLLHSWNERIWGKVWEEITNTGEELSALLLPYISLFSQTIERWCFILCGQNNKKTKPVPDYSNLQITNDVITDILLEKIVLYTTKSEQEEISYWWKVIKADLDRNLNSGLIYNFKERETILKHKIFINNLDEMFRKKVFQKRLQRINDK